MPGYHDPVQHNRHISSFSLDEIKEYFAQLNPIAKRIVYDINDTKALYGPLWETLNYHEQNDIINDSLIKPEISLRYFDNFLTPTPTNSSANSYNSSSDSLTAIVLKDVSKSRNEGDKKNTPIKSNEGKFNTHAMNFYSYDGRTLHSYGIQKVGLKVIQDDALGSFRDEHSRPFCYRTKSQINLFVLQPTIESKETLNSIVPSKIFETTLKIMSPKPKEEYTPKFKDNYHLLQHQLKMNLNENKSQDLQKSSSSLKPSSILVNCKIIKPPDFSFNLDNKDNTSSKSSVLKNYIISTQINEVPKIEVNYAVFSDAYNIAEESSNLLQHCAQSDIATASCSSAATSDDDEKTLETENVHLLDGDSNIRKGFDFLNNW